MLFALLGDHPAGLPMAAALAATGRHELSSFSGVGATPAAGMELLARYGLAAKPVDDIEEILADPTIEAVIVASPIAVRPEHLRRALQSERHVLCVHPPDATPDIAYEAALIQNDTQKVLMPLLTDSLHPEIVALGKLLREASGLPAEGRLIHLERWSRQSIGTELLGKLSFPDWILLRALAGEISEVSAFASGEHVEPNEPLLLSGRFEAGGLFQATLLPGRDSEFLAIRVFAGARHWNLLFHSGLQGPSHLTMNSDASVAQEWQAWQPWPRLVELFESAIAAAGPARQQYWQDAIRCLELDDAARRSLARRRTQVLEYQEVSEAVGFKGTMTLVGCAVLWGILGLLILAAWFPTLKWAIVPILAVFLLLQFLRWMIPAQKNDSLS